MKGKKMNKKQKLEIKLNSLNWENQLPLYLDLYSKLNDEGKKEMQNQVKHLGKLVDMVQKAKRERDNQ